MEEYQTIINYGLGTLLAILGWFARTLWDAVTDLKEDLAALRESIAKEYVPKNDYKDAMREIRDMFNIISKKLDTKADK